MLGGIVTTTVFWALMVDASIEPRTAGLIAIAWLLGLATGGNIDSLLNTLPYRRRRNYVALLAWTPAFLAALASVCGVTAAVTGIERIPDVLGALAVPFALCYGICKVGCWRFGCCGYVVIAGDAVSIRRFPLQTVEAAMSFATAGLVGLLHVAGVRPALVFLAFLVIHTPQRIWATRQRRVHTG